MNVFCVVSLFCGVVLVLVSSLAIILLKKRDLASLLYRGCDRLCSVSFDSGPVGWSAVYDFHWVNPSHTHYLLPVWLPFLTAPWVGLQLVIVAFSGHIHLQWIL